MADDTLTVNPLLTDDVRRYFGSIGGGWRTMSREKRVHLARLGAEGKWKLRRLRYGPSGRKPNDYAKWLRDRGMTLPDELKV